MRKTFTIRLSADERKALKALAEKNALRSEGAALRHLLRREVEGQRREDIAQQ